MTAERLSAEADVGWKRFSEITLALGRAVIITREKTDPASFISIQCFVMRYVIRYSACDPRKIVIQLFEGRYQLHASLGTPQGAQHCIRI